MGKLVGGASEPAITLLPDHKTLLAVFRVEQHTNFWQATSVDGGRHWSAPQQTNAWSVFPQLRTLANGATVLAAGRPGLGLWLLADGGARTARWDFINLAAAHNTACAAAGGCTVPGILNQTALAFHR